MSADIADFRLELLLFDEEVDGFVSDGPVVVFFEHQHSQNLRSARCHAEANGGNSVILGKAGAVPPGVTAVAIVEAVIGADVGFSGVADAFKFVEEGEARRGGSRFSHFAERFKQGARHACAPATTTTSSFARAAGWDSGPAPLRS